jgi:hypothetical protein
MLKCLARQKSKPLAPAFSEDGKADLPPCRGRHPHLRVAPLEEVSFWLGQKFPSPACTGAGAVRVHERAHCGEIARFVFCNRGAHCRCGVHREAAITDHVWELAELLR